MDEHYALYHTRCFWDDKYLFYYYNALVNNYSEVDEDKAISILQEAIVNNKINLVIPHSRIIFNLNLSLQYFDKKEFKLPCPKDKCKGFLNSKYICGIIIKMHITSGIKILTLISSTNSLS